MPFVIVHRKELRKIFRVAVRKNIISTITYSYVGTDEISNFFIVTTRVIQFYYSTMPLDAFVNRTVTLTLPDDLTLFDFDFFSVWCVTASVNFGEVPIPAINRTFIGNLVQRAHGVSGGVYALGERTLMITDFNFDGIAPGT